MKMTLHFPMLAVASIRRDAALASGAAVLKLGALSKHVQALGAINLIGQQETAVLLCRRQS